MSMEWEVEVSQQWTESGTLIVEAESEEDAREIAHEMLCDGDDSITWLSSNMDPGEQTVESVVLSGGKGDERRHDRHDKGKRAT